MTLPEVQCHHFEEDSHEDGTGQVYAVEDGIFGWFQRRRVPVTGGRLTKEMILHNLAEAGKSGEDMGYSEQSASYWRAKLAETNTQLPPGLQSKAKDHCLTSTERSGEAVI